MSQPVASGSQVGQGQGDTGAAAVLPLDQRPETANASVEEKTGSLDCAIIYWFEAEKGDDVKWSIEDCRDGNGMYMRMEVRHKGSDKVVFLRNSKSTLDIPTDIDLRENLKLVKPNPQEVDVKKQCCKVRLKKKVAFDLLPFFKPKSPSPPATNLPPLQDTSRTAVQE